MKTAEQWAEVWASTPTPLVDLIRAIQSEAIEAAIATVARIRAAYEWEEDLAGADIEGAIRALIWPPYYGFFRKDIDGSYGVDFPDLPGCVSGGESFDRAYVNAREALALHLAGLVEDRAPFPSASTMEAVLALPERKNASVVLVSVPDPVQSADETS